MEVNSKHEDICTGNKHIPFGYDVLDYANAFFKINKDHIDGYKTIPASKQKKIDFFYRFILTNKGFFYHKSKGKQLCTTSIAKIAGVTPETVMNWIKHLIKLQMLTCVDRTFIFKFKSRNYTIEDPKLVDLMNKYNGYIDKYGQENVDRLKAKKEARVKNWNITANSLVEYKDLVRIAQCYLGCPDSFLKDVTAHIPLYILEGPSNYNPKKTLFFDAISAFNYVNKKNKYEATADFTNYINYADLSFSREYYRKRHYKVFFHTMKDLIQLLPDFRKERCTEIIRKVNRCCR